MSEIRDLRNGDRVWVESNGLEMKGWVYSSTENGVTTWRLFDRSTIWYAVELTDEHNRWNIEIIEPSLHKGDEVLSDEGNRGRVTRVLLDRIVEFDVFGTPHFAAAKNLTRVAA